MSIPCPAARRKVASSDLAQAQCLEAGVGASAHECG
jgi:hypothetical protein